jgi:hypothetical protein
LPLETGQAAAVVAAAVVVPDDFALPIYSGNPSVLEINYLPRCWAEKGKHNGRDISDRGTDRKHFGKYRDLYCH